MDQAIERILGDTPEFKRVVPSKKKQFKIQMKIGMRNNDLQAKICNAVIGQETPNLVQATNSGTDTLQFLYTYIYLNKWVLISI